MSRAVKSASSLHNLDLLIGAVTDYRDIGWFLNEWMDALGYSQADLTRALRWERTKISRLCTGRQKYNQEVVEEIAAVMGLAPYELLLAPKMARRAREAMIRAKQEDS